MRRTKWIRDTKIARKVYTGNIESEKNGDIEVWYDDGKESDYYKCTGTFTVPVSGTYQINMGSNSNIIQIDSGQTVTTEYDVGVNSLKVDGITHFVMIGTNPSYITSVARIK